MVTKPKAQSRKSATKRFIGKPGGHIQDRVQARSLERIVAWSRIAAEPSELATLHTRQWQDLNSLRESWQKRDALFAVQTSDETVWSLRASDIYQGDDTEPPPASESASPTASHWTTECEKTTFIGSALNVRADINRRIRP